jgi:tRNA threonylcarbamoyladenosine biosynthesis protein TsaB
MRVLAIDTTRLDGSVALVENGRVLDVRHSNPVKTQAERLPVDLLQLLKETGRALSQIDLFAVAAGPGSFTGLRIGIATMQGLAFVGKRRMVVVSALDAIAHAASAELSPGNLVASWMDAHRGEVFSALYRIGSGRAFTRGRLEEVDRASVGPPSEILARWAARFAEPDVFAGDGAVRFADRIGSGRRVVDPQPLAGTIGLVASERAEESVDPADVRPLYVRRPDAEIARDKREAEGVRSQRPV